MENRRMLQRVLEQVDQVILGKERENREILLAFLAGGNVLLEDIPGVGKTTLALAFSRAMGLEHRRIQFTPDVLPSDLTGFPSTGGKPKPLSTSRGACSAIFCWRTS